MRPVLQHLGLDDRDDPRLLAERGVARERVRVRPDAVLARLVGVDRVRRAPLREARAELAVLLEPRAQPVEAFGDRLAVRERERLRTLVDLDPGDDALRLEQLRERRAVVPRLADRLVEEDDAADVLLDAFGREQQVAVGAPVVLRRLDADRVETLLDRAGALVRGEDPFPLGDECACRVSKSAIAHLLALSIPQQRLCPRHFGGTSRERCGRRRSTTPDGSRASREPCPRPSARRR